MFEPITIENIDALIDNARAADALGLTWVVRTPPGGESWIAAPGGNYVAIVAKSIDLPDATHMVGLQPSVAIPLLERLKYLERLALPDERATPEGHLDAWADTNEGYSVRKGWTITCLWCNAEFYGDTKTHALGSYEIHEQQMIKRAEANHLKEVIACSSPT